MLPYQIQMVESFVRMLRPGTTAILEIGSDIGGEVVTALAGKTGARVTGINPSPSFPQPEAPLPANAFLLNADGRSLPFSDNSFDAIFSVATMEHVNGVDLFLSEVARVLGPGGIFYTEFCPLWSSALGHHVYAVVGRKEARFWKPGKNPIPDYAHLLWSPEEMKAHLESSPCAEELIEPILQWVYHGDSINRQHFENYIAAFAKTSLVLRRLRLDYDQPNDATLAELSAKYGPERNFRCSSIAAQFRKIPDTMAGELICRAYWRTWCKIDYLAVTLFTRLRYAAGTALFSLFPPMGAWYAKKRRGS